jgi:hypothetical protein
MHQMQVDVEQRQLSSGNTNHVLIPDLVEQRELLNHGLMRDPIFSAGRALKERS